MTEDKQAQTRTASTPTGGELDEATAAVRARALSSPLRWRVLRLCLHEARTNKELADALDVNPGSMLHHVRTLVGAGYLAPQEARRGARNAVEMPYLATELTWQAASGTTEVAAFLRDPLEPDAAGPAPADSPVRSADLLLDDALRDEFAERLDDLVATFRGRGDSLTPGSGRRWLVTVALRPDPGGGAGQAA